MPVFLLGLLNNKFVWYGLAAAAALVAFLWYRSSLIHEGEAKLQAAVQAATQAEQARESQINQDWSGWADGAKANADVQKAQIDDLQKQLAVATAADNAPCLSASVVDRLRAIGKSGVKAGPTSTTFKPHH